MTSGGHNRIECNFIDANMAFNTRTIKVSLDRIWIDDNIHIPSLVFIDANNSIYSVKLYIFFLLCWHSMKQIENLLYNDQ